MIGAYMLFLDAIFGTHNNTAKELSFDTLSIPNSGEGASCLGSHDLPGTWSTKKNKGIEGNTLERWTGSALAGSQE